MKKYLRPLGLVLAFLLLTGGTYAALTGDSLVSLSYLRDAFFPSAVQKGEEAANKALQKTYDSAKTQLDAVSEGENANYSDTLQRREWPDGQIITLPAGAGFLLLDGSANLVHTGAVIDVTAGTEVASGSTLALNHRYLVAENTEAAVTVRSGQAAIGLQGA